MTKLPELVCILAVLDAAQSFGQEWISYEVDDTGDNPSIALDTAGVPHLAYFSIEAAGDSHKIKFASWNQIDSTFNIEVVNTGGFQEHTAIIIGSDNVPHVCYHDHGIGDLIHSYRDGTNWINERIFDEGHDGWSCSITLDSDNLPHVSYLDSSLRDPNAPGVQYGWKDGSGWNVEVVGSETALYWFRGTSIDLNNSNTPYISYYDDVQQSLNLAVKNGAVWTITTVDSSGDVGRYSSLRLDANGFPRIAYFEYLSDTSGIIKLAQFSQTSWQFFNIDTLYNFDLALVPQDVISLQIDSQGNSHIAYSDRSTLMYAVLSGNTLTKEVVVDVTGGHDALGQSASLALDQMGTPHLGYLGPSGTSPSTVMYVVKEAGAAPVLSDIPDQTIMPGGKFTDVILDEYVTDPDNLDSEISWTFSGNVNLTVQYDTASRTVTVRPLDGWTGSETITFTATDPYGNSATDDGTYSVSPQTGFSGARESAPEATVLRKNYPNPFNPTTTIQYELAHDTRVTLSIHNALGQEVITLLDDYQTAGKKSIIWDGMNGAGEPVSGGAYFYRLSTVDAVITQKMILLR